MFHVKHGSESRAGKASTVYTSFPQLWKTGLWEAQAFVDQEFFVSRETVLVYQKMGLFVSRETMGQSFLGRATFHTIHRFSTTSAKLTNVRK